MSARSSRRKTNAHPPVALVVGGAGFIGCNLTHRLVEDGYHVRVLDNLSRPGVEWNADWLLRTHRSDVDLVIADLRNRATIRRSVAGADVVYHLAAQVAVTTSLDDPVYDFEVNLRGTLHLLEELRRTDEPVPLIFTSTNKVYGALDRHPLVDRGGRYELADPKMAGQGFGEREPLCFHSPYGCSKGAADQYVLDYARVYGIPSVVFRMSCIYGPRQCGTEDQGWVAHFLVRAIEGKPITIYGDGKQVRDILYVDDLVEALIQVHEHIDRTRGMAFNVGGSTQCNISLLELIDLIEIIHGERPRYDYGPWRIGDQKYYVSDTRRLQAVTGWRPRVEVREGIERLHAWLCVERPTRREKPQTAAERASASAFPFA